MQKLRYLWKGWWKLAPLQEKRKIPAPQRERAVCAGRCTVCGEELALGYGYLQYLQHHWDVGTLLLHILSDISLL